MLEDVVVIYIYMERFMVLFDFRKVRDVNTLFIALNDVREEGLCLWGF